MNYFIKNFQIIHISETLVALNHNHIKDKFDPRSIKGIFVGYPVGQKGYKIYCPELHKTIISRDVQFFEDTYPSIPSEPDNIPLPFVTLGDPFDHLDTDRPSLNHTPLISEPSNINNH